MVQVNQHDLEFILRQIKIAEANSIAHSGTNASALTNIWIDELGNVVPQGTPGASLAISAEHVPYGLRTVDGSYNNLGEGRENWGAADQPFERLLEQGWRVETDDTITLVTGFGQTGPTFTTLNNSTYSPTGAVVDADPRLISNLVVDQTLANPAAIYTALVQSGYSGDVMAAVTAIRAEFTVALGIAKANNSLLPTAQQKTVAVLAAEVTEVLAADRPASQAGPAFEGLESRYGLTFDGPSVLLENVAPDEGLSAPYNSWFTLFGQFFDHGLDLVEKGGNDKIYIPLSPEDPLYVPGSFTNYMVLTRAPQEPDNFTTPFVDQNQTYSSVASKQLFLREYKLVDGKPMATGHLLEGAKGIATWAEVKAQAKNILGINLTDEYVGSVPLFEMDAYGEFVRGPNGFPLLVTTGGLVEGVPGAGAISLNTALLTGHAFLDDIAHDAVPVIVGGVAVADGDAAVGLSNAGGVPVPRIMGQLQAYDNELLDAHFVTGDGRGNENIGLTAVHHIFHSEHNKMVDQVKARAIEAAQSGDLNFLNEWLSTRVQALPQDLNTLKWDGERLFQAARFTTEMQYQHLVFEEFARKIQPDIDVFVFNPSMDINPAIFAEFAHVVYRFGHSMLNETVDSVSATGAKTPMDLFDAFLNPVAYADGITADQGAGAVIRGMTGQVGNEIDEFVTDVLRNHLVGIPLDLPALNIARGRETGIPSLNAARAQFKEIANGDTQLDPYKNWVDFGMNLKNPASIVNFIAAYGTHSSIATVLDPAAVTPENPTGSRATTMEEKRDAAMKLVLGDDTLTGQAKSDFDADRAAFLNGTGAYTDLGGLNDVDLWIGGLAEKKMAFGGMLGSTFSFVFELQLENLQNGDRFYYLSRTQGLNLLNELEANSLAELVIRNTDIGELGYAVPGDIFSVPDHVLYVDLAEQTKWGYSDPVGNDPFQNALAPVVQRGANYIKYYGLDHVLIQGTNQADTIIAGGGDDTVWGRGGDDRIEAGYGVDKVHGGEGDDIITNSGTDIGETDFLMGEEGDDVIHGGSGLALVFGNQGSDVLIAGPDGKEMFGGEGNDFMLGGEGSDFLLGNEGDDWIEAGNGFDTTAGDNSELFFNSTILGHDVMFAGENEHDFDAESGDDIMVQGESVMRNEGMWGYDWAIHKGSTKAADADLLRPIFTTEQQDILRNRYDAVEGLSGYKQNDVLKGDHRATAFPSIPDPEAEPGANLAGAENTMVNHHLSQAGIDRIAGLRELLGDLVQASNTVGAAAREAEIAFDDGNILLGGGGSDQIEGRGGDDVIDGDAWLNVRIRITTPSGVYTADSLAGPVHQQSQLVNGEIPANTPPAFGGKALSDLLLERTITPGQMEIVREIVDGGQVGDTDIAVYSDIRANYTVAQNDDGSFTVTHVAVDPTGILGLVNSDGVDRLRNIEVLRFNDGDVSLTPPKLYLQTPSSQYRDNFDSPTHNNSNGTAVWTSAWIESNDTTTGNIVTGGQIQLDNGQTQQNQGTNQLRFVGGDGAQIQRAVNLAGATTATLAYTVQENSLDAADGDSVRVFFSRDGSEANFVQVDLINNNTSNATRNISLTGPFTENAAIRIVSTALGNNDDVRIDNLAITYTSAPVVDYETTYTEDGANQNLASSPVIIENDRIASARIVLTNAQQGDSFDIPGNLPGNINSTVDNSVAGRITVTLTGNEPSIAAWQAAIQSIQFQSNSQNPSTVDRIVEITVNDGLFNSNVATTTINVVAVDDPANAVGDTVITNIAAGTIVVPEWVLLANDTDPDSVLDITAVSAANGVADLSLLTNPGFVSLTDAGPAGGQFTYTANGDTANVQLQNQGRIAATDDFNPNGYTGASDGGLAWNGNWTENDNNNAGNGDILVTGNRLNFNSGVDGGEWVQRSVNLAGRSSATLSFDYEDDNLGNGQNVLVRILNVVSGQWETVGTLGSTTATGNGTFSIPLTANQIGAGSAIRFETTGDGNNWDNGDNFYIDNVRVEVPVVANVTGGNGNEILLGNDAASTFDGGTGNDFVLAGGGADAIVWNANAAAGGNNANSDGRDFVDGGAGTDTFIVNGNNNSEVYRLYTRVEAIAAGLADLRPDTEIVVTRGGTASANIIAELDNIEEIVVNTQGGPGDNIIVIGDFTQTSLALNTITIDGTAGDDVIDISQLASAHRIVFRSNGGNDTIVGTLRPQDVVIGGDGSNLSTFTRTVNSDGSVSFTKGSQTIKMTGGDMGDGDNPTGPFEYTARDIQGITNLLNGLPAFAGDDDTVGAGGVRDLSGNGNNIDNPAFGAADEPFIRLTEARYGAGFETDAQGNIINRALNPIFDGLDARAISNLLGAQEAGLPKAPNEANIFFMTFGQYFDHGLDFLPKGGAGKVIIDGADIPGLTATNFTDLTRGSLANPLQSATDIPEHLNKASPYVDQNQVYGSNAIVGQFLRESDGNGGVGSHILMGPEDPSAPGFHLMSTLRELLDHHRAEGTLFKGAGLPAGGITIDAYYPTLWNSETGSYDAATVRQLAGDFMGSTHALLLDANPIIDLLDHYVGGDGRANENFTLTSMHTIWARNHNFHVEKLSAAGFVGTAEELFQAAKMVNEAEYQRVVFTEFADALIGGIQGNGSHGFEAYNDQATASISHEFAAAVYRIGHSLIGDTVSVKGPDGETYSVNLFDAFLNPTNDVFTPEQLVQLRAMGYDPQPGYEQLGTGAILSGIVEQAAEDVDFNVVDAVRNDLVRIRADLFAFNVARGRDVGLGTLNQVKADLKASTDPYVKFAVDFLEANGRSMNPYSSWQDFQQRNGLSNVVIAQFMAAYPDLILQASQIEAFKAINGNIVAVQTDGTGVVKGIDRVDLWVGGLAETHFNGGMAGDTFWVVLHEQFDRLQEADRFYYLERFDNFDLYENFIDGQNFSDIVARNTGLTGLPEDIFTNDLEDGPDDGADDDDGDDDGDTGGVDDDDDDDDGNDDDAGSDDEDGDDDDDAGAGSGGGSGGGVTPTPVPVAALTLIGTSSSDALVGSGGADVILGGAGTDVLVGQGGSDILRGEDGDDVITGGDGDDFVNAGLGDDEVHAGDGHDIVFGGAGSDQIFAGAGNDVIEGGAGDDRVWGGEGDDTVIATLNDGND
ncbi:MAG: peroxidase family protein, partial [Rhizobium rhizophilum]|uniref:peroxidase family protein n=1 Tax=Rhizobium rhizophilum TaxID=1850373 RepID=UPI00391AF12E